MESGLGTWVGIDVNFYSRCRAETMTSQVRNQTKLPECVTFIAIMSVESGAWTVTRPYTFHPR